MTCRSQGRLSWPGCAIFLKFGHFAAPSCQEGRWQKCPLLASILRYCIKNADRAMGPVRSLAQPCTARLPAKPRRSFVRRSAAEWGKADRPRQPRPGGRTVRAACLRCPEALTDAKAPAISRSAPLQAPEIPSLRRPTRGLAPSPTRTSLSLRHARPPSCCVAAQGTKKFKFVTDDERQAPYAMVL